MRISQSVRIETVRARFVISATSSASSSRLLVFSPASLLHLSASLLPHLHPSHLLHDCFHLVSSLSRCRLHDGSTCCILLSCSSFLPSGSLTRSHGSAVQLISQNSKQAGAGPWGMYSVVTAKGNLHAHSKLPICLFLACACTC